MRDYDIILFGASGFTGKLVAEYLRDQYGISGELRWAIAGRNPEKLQKVAVELGIEGITILQADSSQPEALRKLAAASQVICSTVGPYALYGSELVAACAEQGTHYCDLTGEVHWMRDMIDRHQQAAIDSGARIVHTCGFDSIPSDLGVLYLQNAMQSAHDTPAREIKFRVKGFSGAFSGGTVASMINMMEEASKDKHLRKVIADPYALLPEDSHRGDDTEDQTSAIYDEHFKRWSLPFIMAAINTRVVRRSNALLDFAWGEDFRYDEAILAPANQGTLTAKATAFMMNAGTISLAVPPLRAVAKRFLPKPGEGPDKEQRDNGYFDIYLYGVNPNDSNKDMIARVTGDRDPGYGSTSKMLGEAAVCLAKDDLACAGGFWTPASAMGEPLIERLQQNAGLSFSIEKDLP